MKSPLIRAAGATVGTFLALGAVTMGVTTVTMGVIRTVLKHQKKKVAVVCKPCQGNRYQKCRVCRGQHLVDWSPFQDPSGVMLVLCPLCGGYGQQKCLNCLSEGTVAPLKGPPWFVEKYA